jgi:phosphate transport system substrate-binding protein
LRSKISLLVAACALFLVCGCARAHAQAKPDPLAGVYSAGSGGGAIAHAQALATRFTQLHPGVSLQVENVGSDAGINLAATGGIDVGFTSRDLTEDEKTKVKPVLIGGVGTAVIVNADNPIKALTGGQVRGIFSGEITDWSQVGGTPGNIQVIVREKTASTRIAFDSYFFPGKPIYTEDAAELRDIDQMTETVKSFKTAIGMATLEDATLAKPGIKALAIDGAPATMAALADGSYPVRRNVYLVYNPDPSKEKPAIRAFVDFAQSAEGHRVLANVNAPGGGGVSK